MKESIPVENPSSTKDRRWTIGFAVFVVIITSIPYLLGYARQGTDWRFTGFVFGVEDGNSYIAKMLSGANGSWLFKTPYTTSPQKGIFAYTPYILLGKLASPPGEHDQLVVLYHIFRCFSVFLAILATSDFVRLFIRDTHLNRLALVLITLGGGLGWVLLLFGHSSWSGTLPLDYYSPESFGFLSLFGLPHLALARALLLWGLTFYLQNQTESNLRQWRMGNYLISFPSGFITGVLWFLLGFAQPLTVVVGWILVSAHLAGSVIWMWFISRNKLTDRNRWLQYAKKGLVAIGISAPLVIYTGIASRIDPFLRTWLAQNIIISPEPIQYLFAYGLLFPLVLIGGYSILRKDIWTGWFLVGWVILLPFLAYAPVNIQRRLPEGIWVAIVILACGGLARVHLYIRQRQIEGKYMWSKYLSRLLYLPLASLFVSTIILLLGGITSVLNPMEPIFRPTAEVDAFQFLAEQVSPTSVVFTSYETGNALPAWAPVKVIIGHGPESVDLAYLRPKVDDVFNGNISDIERHDFLDEMKVNYILWGPAEMRLGAWNPTTESYLNLIYNKNGYSIFKMIE